MSSSQLQRFASRLEIEHDRERYDFQICDRSRRRLDQPLTAMFVLIYLGITFNRPSAGDKCAFYVGGKLLYASTDDLPYTIGEAVLPAVTLLLRDS